MFTQQRKFGKCNYKCPKRGARLKKQFLNLNQNYQCLCLKHNLLVTVAPGRQ